MLTQNYHCRLGEIDLIMQSADNALVFVEVRYREEDHHGDAIETVDNKKQRKLKRAVLHYLQHHADATAIARIDVVGIKPAPARMPHDKGTQHKEPLHSNRSQQNLTALSDALFRGHVLRWIISAVEDDD